jgi:molybdate transport system substrate-binding protein
VTCVIEVLARRRSGPPAGEACLAAGRALRARTRVLCVALCVALAGCNSRTSESSPPVRVAAASSLLVAFEDLADTYEQELASSVAFSFGSSGLLANQIRGGAPFDVYAPAHVSFVDEVVEAGVCDGTTQAHYARGRIAVWTRAGSAERVAALSDLAEARFSRIAIANPEHAPYGQAAREALEDAGLWDLLSAKLVYGENISQALQFAQTGNVDAAIVALSLVIHDDENPWTLIAEDRHEPIEQALVVCAGGGNRKGGEAFVALLGSQSGRELMRRHGFALPGGEPPPTQARARDEL